MSLRWRQAVRAPGVAVFVLAVVASSCVGTVTRSEFDAEIQARGGGVSVASVAVALDLVADEVGAPSADVVEVLSISITPSTSTLVARARRADRPDFVDVIVVRQGSVISSAPLRDAADMPLDDLVVSVGAVPFDRLEAMADDAVREFGESDGYVSGIVVSNDDGRPSVQMSLESARLTGTVTFDADGVMVGGVE